MQHKILIVDDEPEILNLMSMILKSSSYETVTAADGEQALDRVVTEHPDLVLLDLWLPKMNGFEVMKNMQRDDRTAGIPVILVTADANYKEAAGDFEVKDVVIKPFSTEEMLEKIKSYLG